jgi:F-type H+-transporting ATPase subunit beta
VFNVSYQPFHVAEQFTGLKGVLVDIKDTIKGFNMIIDGELLARISI